MNCGNCGAPMELFERRRYSSVPTAVPSRSSTRRRLRASAFWSVRCRRLTVRGAAHRSSRLSWTTLYSVEHCEQCRGILLPRAAFAEAVTRRRARQSGAPAPPVPMDPRELKLVVVCPSCRSQMDVHPHHGPGNVVIDSCQRCDLIWLDFGELTQITEAGGRDWGWRVSSS